MGNIHDALDKAIQQVEKEKESEASPTRNAYTDQVVAHRGVQYKIDPEFNAATTNCYVEQL